LASVFFSTNWSWLFSGFSAKGSPGDGQGEKIVEELEGGFPRAWRWYVGEDKGECPKVELDEMVSFLVKKVREKQTGP
jgi:hypothetical protein